MWSKLMWRLWCFESMIYHKIGKVPEGGLLPWWAWPIRRLFHPSIFFREGAVYKNPTHNMLHAYGVNISFEFLKFQKAKFKDGTVAYKRNGEWVYWMVNPGDWLQVKRDGLEHHLRKSLSMILAEDAYNVLSIPLSLYDEVEKEKKEKP
jgi:hypothetical protein